MTEQPTGPRQPDDPRGQQDPPPPGGEPLPAPGSPGPESPPVPPGTQSQYAGPAPPGGLQQPPMASRAGQLAGWEYRLGATLLDFLIVGAAGFVLGFILGLILGIGFVAAGSEDDTGLNIAANVIGIVVGFAVYAAYTGALMTRDGARNGQTVGKQVLGIRVIRVDGEPVALRTVAVRHWLMKYFVFGYLAILTLYIATLLNYLWPLWDSEKRAFHDMAAKTRVVFA